MTAQPHLVERITFFLIIDSPWRPEAPIDASSTYPHVPRV
jgi:hypothetical protein